MERREEKELQRTPLGLHSSSFESSILSPLKDTDACLIPKTDRLMEGNIIQSATA